MGFFYYWTNDEASWCLATWEYLSWTDFKIILAYYNFSQARKQCFKLTDLKYWWDYTAWLDSPSWYSATDFYFFGKQYVCRFHELPHCFEIVISTAFYVSVRRYECNPALGLLITPGCEWIFDISSYLSNFSYSFVLFHPYVWFPIRLFTFEMKYLE